MQNLLEYHNFTLICSRRTPGWRQAKGYDYRWMSESAFSSIKRVFGEYITSIKWGNIVKELLLKASIYNLFMSMNH
jgi:transposase